MQRSKFYSKQSIQEFLECESELEEVVSALVERDYRVYGVEQPANVLVPYHTHESDEVIVVLEGAVKLFIEEEPVVIEEGDVLTVRAHAIHSAATLHNRPAKLLLGFDS